MPTQEVLFFRAVSHGKYITYSGTIKMVIATTKSVQQGLITIPDQKYFPAYKPTVNLTFYRKALGSGQIDFPIYGIEFEDDPNSVKIHISIQNPHIDSLGHQIEYPDNDGSTFIDLPDNEIGSDRHSNTVFCDFTVTMNNQITEPVGGEPFTVYGTMHGGIYESAVFGPCFITSVLSSETNPEGLVIEYYKNILLPSITTFKVPAGLVHLNMNVDEGYKFNIRAIKQHPDLGAGDAAFIYWGFK